MAKITYSTESPYKNTTQTNWYLLPLKHRLIPEHNTDTLTTIDNKYDSRPSLMSYDLYGTPNYWWVFLVRNMDTIRDPIGDFKSGTEIWVPSKNRLNELLQS